MLNTYKKGFTIVELLIVISVLAILAGLSTVGYNGIKNRAADTTSKSDGVNVAEQIELSFIKAGTFPLNEAALSAYKKDANTDLEYTSNTGNTAYCLEIWNTKAGSKHFTVRDDKSISEGTCIGWVPSNGTVTPPAPSDPAPTIASVTSNSFVISWSAVTGAQSYTVHLGTTTSSGVPNGSAPGCAPTSALSCTISGLSPSTTYYVGLSVTVSGGSTYYGYQNVTTNSNVPRNFTASVTGCSGGVPYDIVGLQFNWAAPNSGITLQNYVIHSTNYPETGAFTTGPDDFYATTNGTTYTVSGAENNTGGSRTYRIHGLISTGVNTPDAQVTISIPNC